MGITWYRLAGKETLTVRQAIGVNEAKTINANDAVYSDFDYALAA